MIQSDSVICPHCRCSEFVEEFPYTNMKGYRHFKCNNPSTHSNHHTLGRCDYWYIQNELLIYHEKKYKKPFKNSLFDC